MKKMMIIAVCVGGLACMLACNKEEVGAYTPLPKIHLGETFGYPKSGAGELHPARI